MQQLTRETNKTKMTKRSCSSSPEKYTKQKRLKEAVVANQKNKQNKNDLKKLQQLTRTKKKRKLEAQWAEPVSLTFYSVFEETLYDPSIGASYQIQVHLATRFQRRSFIRNQPIRNKNCLWWPCLLTDRDEMSNLYRGPSIDVSQQVSVHLTVCLFWQVPVRGVGHWTKVNFHFNNSGQVH